MKRIKDLLFKYRDTDYAIFQARLVPSVDKDLFIGVRVPHLRKLAKEIKDDVIAKEFLSELPHKYYDENILHGILISDMKDYDKVIKEMEHFLPYIDNWAVCDIINPKVFKNHKDKLLEKIYEWIDSKDSYTIRFGLKMLMTYYLDDDFKAEYLKLASNIRSKEYYVNMMIAWFFATALSKKWDNTIIYLNEKRLDEWVHKKTIQKARESYRITDEQKKYLKTL